MCRRSSAFGRTARAGLEPRRPQLPRMAAVHKIQGPYRIMNEHVQDEPNRLLKGCRSLEQAPSASVEAASARLQLEPRAAALAQRPQAERSRLALPMALEGSEWGGVLEDLANVKSLSVFFGSFIQIVVFSGYLLLAIRFI